MSSAAVAQQEPSAELNSGPGSQASHLILQGSARRLIRTLTIMAVALCVVGLATRLLSLTVSDFPGRDFIAGLTRLDSESTLPAAFSTALLIFCSLMLGTIAATSRLTGAAGSRSWFGLSFLFAYLALDEYAMIHERTVPLIREVLSTGGALQHAWVIPYGALVLVVALTFRRFLMRLPPAIRWGLLLAGGLYVTGALGFELLEGRLRDILGRESASYVVLSATEELLEMLGLILFLSTLLRYARLVLPGLRVTLSLDSRSAQSQRISPHDDRAERAKVVE